jgi:hypothetical protein
VGAVGTAEIAAGAVGPGEIAAGAVGSAEIADGSIGRDKLAADVGSGAPQAAFVKSAGAPGAIGTDGNNPTEIAALTSLPQSAYLVAATFWIDVPAAAPVVTCHLEAGAQELQTIKQDTFGLQNVAVTLQGAATLQGGVRLSCSASGAGADARDVRLTATQAGSLTAQ